MIAQDDNNSIKGGIMKGFLLVLLLASVLFSCTPPDTTPSPGSTWTARTLPSPASWESVTYGNGVFVAIAYGGTAAATSP